MEQSGVPAGVFPGKQELSLAALLSRGPPFQKLHRASTLPSRTGGEGLELTCPRREGAWEHAELSAGSPRPLARPLRCPNFRMRPAGGGRLGRATRPPSQPPRVFESGPERRVNKQACLRRSCRNAGAGLGGSPVGSPPSGTGVSRFLFQALSRPPPRRAVAGRVRPGRFWKWFVLSWFSRVASPPPMQPDSAGAAESPAGSRPGGLPRGPQLGRGQGSRHPAAAQQGQRRVHEGECSCRG